MTIGGALLDAGWTQITVPAPADPKSRPLRGDGWTLELAHGVTLVPGDRAGDLTLTVPRPQITASLGARFLLRSLSPAQHGCR